MSSLDGSKLEKLIESVAQIRNQVTRLNVTGMLGADPGRALDEIERLTLESMECISDGSIAVDSGLCVVALSRTAEERLKKSAADVAGRNLFEAFPEMHSAFLAEQLTRAMAGKGPVEFVALFSSPLQGWYEVRVLPSGSGAELYFHAISRDEAHGMGRLRQPLPDAAKIALRACRRSMGGTRGRVVLFNEPAADIEVIMVNPSHIQRQNDALFAAERSSAWSRAAATRHAVTATVGVKGDGETQRDNLLCVPLVIDDAVAGLLELEAGPRAFSDEDAAVASSVAECLALSVRDGRPDGAGPRRSGEVARTLFDSRESAAYMTTFTGRIIDANQVMWERLGYARGELLTLNSRALYSHRSAPRLPAHVSTLRRTGHAVCEAELVRRDGTFLPVELDSLLITYDGEPAILTVARDMQRQKSLEALRTQSRKMEAAGDLARGIAHDFGDLAASILGRVDLLLTESALSPEVSGHLRQMKKEAQRATDLTLRLLAFNGKHSARPKLVDLNALVGGMEQRIARLVDERAILTTHMDPAVGSVLADPALLEQAVIELALIAREALSGNGEITLQTRAVRAGEAPLRLHPEADYVDHVALILRETGPGIAGTALQQIHEPFFTSTTQERGTAMGLATVHGIITQLGGFIEAEGSPANGATFRVFLPSFTPLSPRDHAIPPGAALHAASAEVILLVEEDAGFRQREENVLAQYGFTVRCASRVEEAFSVLSDGQVVMAAVAPAAQEGEMARELGRRFPRAGLILVADEREGERETHGLPCPRRARLRKPFSMRELALTVWELAGHGRE